MTNRERLANIGEGCSYEKPCAQCEMKKECLQEITNRKKYADKKEAEEMWGFNLGIILATFLFVVLGIWIVMDAYFDMFKYL